MDGSQELTKSADAVESFLNAKGVIYAISDPNIPPTPLGTTKEKACAETGGLAQKGIKHAILAKGGIVAQQEDWDKEFTTPKR